MGPKASAPGGPAGIEYLGLARISQACQEAVIRRVQYGEKIAQALILTSAGTHCLLLGNGIGDQAAVKSGFASGYGGEGPNAFSYVLQLLDAHGTEIEEVEVEPELLDRLDDSALTVADLHLINTARPVRPLTWYRYILDDDRNSDKHGRLWRELQTVIPFPITDPGLIHVALRFLCDPAAHLLTGYRRLEDV